jgi:hypothetical protein
MPAAKSVQSLIFRDRVETQPLRSQSFLTTLVRVDSPHLWYQIASHSFCEEVPQIRQSSDLHSPL